MGQDEKKLLVIAGPTASGKSALAVALAKKLGGEVVSADSRQIYRGLAIGSNYPTTTELKMVPHHLINFADPKKMFTAAEYQKKARKKIGDIWRRRKLPILVGGTGFYIQSIVDGIVMPEVPPNKALRKELEMRSTGELADILYRKDKKRWETVDRRNRRRLIRAIEIAAILGKVPALKLNPIQAKVLIVGIDPDKKTFEVSVKKRAKAMIRRGFIDETEELLKNGVAKERVRELGFEYQDALRYLEGKIKSKQELVDAITRMTLKYAKRQMTWFRRDKRIVWVHGPNEVLPIVRQPLAKKSQSQNPKS